MQSYSPTPAGFGVAIPIGQPQVQHFAAPITDPQGQVMGQIEVHKESVPMLVQTEDEGPNEKTKEELVQYMMCMAGFLHELRTQAHLIHLNFCGPEFLGVHKFLKKQYEKHQEQFDRISEVLRSLDFYMPMCSKGLCGAVRDFKHCTSYGSKEMLSTYLCNLESGGMKAKCLGKSAKVADAADVENLAADLVEAMFVDAYMIKSTLRQA